MCVTNVTFLSMVDSILYAILNNQSKSKLSGKTFIQFLTWFLLDIE